MNPRGCRLMCSVRGGARKWSRGGTPVLFRDERSQANLATGRQSTTNGIHTRDEDTTQGGGGGRKGNENVPCDTSAPTSWARSGSLMPRSTRPAACTGRTCAGAGAEGASRAPRSRATAHHGEASRPLRGAWPDRSRARGPGLADHPVATRQTAHLPLRGAAFAFCAAAAPCPPRSLCPSCCPCHDDCLLYTSPSPRD